MGNHRFRLSDMIPNAWFYKLKDMSKNKIRHKSNTTTNTNNNYHFKRSSTTNKTNKVCQQTNSKSSETRFYSSPVNTKASDTLFPHDPPRKSSPFSKQRVSKSKRKTVYRPSILADDSLYYSSSDPPDGFFPDDPESLFSESDVEDDDFLGQLDGGEEVSVTSWSNSCQCKLNSDIIFDMNDESSVERNDGFVSDSEVELPPILTKGTKTSKETNGINNSRISMNPNKIGADKSHNFSNYQPAKARTRNEKKSTNSSPSRKSMTNSTGIKIRSNSPRLASKKMQSYARKSMSRNRNLKYSNCAVVKSSMDPLRDFMDSMVEMIEENNIKGSKELEDLLACYLSLNSKEYHELIVQAFEQIWLYMS